MPVRLNFIWHHFVPLNVTPLVTGGHLDVVQLLVSNRADIDSQDNRRVSSLMTAFRKGHIKVVKWLVRHVTQFPSDQECGRYIATVNDKVGGCEKLCFCYRLLYH